MVKRLNLFFAHSFLSISSVFTEQSQICVKNAVSVSQAQGDLLRRSNLTHFFAPADLLIMTPKSSIEIPHKKIYCRSTKERVENLPQPDQLMKFCADTGFLKTVEVGQYFMTKYTDEFLQIAEPVTCCEYILPRDDKLTDPTGGFKGTPKLDACWKSQPVTCKVNME